MSNLMRALIVLSAAFLTLARFVVEPVPVHFQPIVPSPLIVLAMAFRVGRAH